MNLAFGRIGPSFQEASFHFWPESFHLPSFMAKNPTRIPSRKGVMHTPLGGCYRPYCFLAPHVYV